MLKDQNANIGEVAIIKHESRFIYYLVTKSNGYQKPTYENLKLSIAAMKKHMVNIAKQLSQCCSETFGTYLFTLLYHNNRLRMMCQN